MWSVKDGCHSLVVDSDSGTCPGGQAGQGRRNETVLTGMMGAVEDYTVGNGYCGGWNMVMADTQGSHGGMGSR